MLANNFVSSDKQNELMMSDNANMKNVELREFAGHLKE